MKDQRRDDDGFFVGWVDPPEADRRFFLRAGLGLMAGTVALGSAWELGGMGTGGSGIRGCPGLLVGMGTAAASASA